MKEEYIRYTEEYDWNYDEYSEYERLNNKPLFYNQRYDRQCETHIRKWIHEREHMMRW